MYIKVIYASLRSAILRLTTLASRFALSGVNNSMTKSARQSLGLLLFLRNSELDLYKKEVN